MHELLDRTNVELSAVKLVIIEIIISSLEVTNLVSKFSHQHFQLARSYHRMSNFDIVVTEF